MLSIRSAVLSTASVTGLLLATACGSNTTGSVAEDKVTGHDEAVADLVAARELVLQSSTYAFTYQAAISQDGLELTVESSGAAVEDPVAFEMKVSTESAYSPLDQELTFRYIGGAAYATSPELFEGLDLGGARWVAAELDAAEAEQLPEKVDEIRAAAMGPDLVLGLMLECDVVTFHGAGRYTGSLTTLALREADTDLLPQAETEELAGQLDALNADGIELDLRLNEDGLPAQLEMTTETPSGRLSGNVAYHYGDGISVQQPPPETVINETDLTSDAGESIDIDPLGMRINKSSSGPFKPSDY